MIDITYFAIDFISYKATVAISIQYPEFISDLSIE